MRKVAEVEIKGLSALLMHRYPTVPVEALEKKPIAEQAELASYRTPEGKLYLPGTALQRCLVNGATFVKGKGRSTMQKQVAACVFVTPEYIDFGTQEYKIDSRPVVIPATKGKVMRHRPLIAEWKASFTLEFDNDLLSEDQMRSVVDNSGSRVGVLDFRPEKKGPFGRFIVTKWELQK